MVKIRADLAVQMLNQPDDITCGPTCLQAVYGYFGDPVPLQQVIAEVPRLDDGGTLAVFLACHALRRGYQAVIYSYDLEVFDPSWFTTECDVASKLRAQAAFKNSDHHWKLQLATAAYQEFFGLGGSLRQRDLTVGLLNRCFAAGLPVLTGLSATWLYRSMREIHVRADRTEYHDVQGLPSGHFVVLCGYDRTHRHIVVADPFKENPVSGSHYYTVGAGRLISSIMLGIATYDANLLILRPGGAERIP